VIVEALPFCNERKEGRQLFRATRAAGPRHAPAFYPAPVNEFCVQRRNSSTSALPTIFADRAALRRAAGVRGVIRIDHALPADAPHFRQTLFERGKAAARLAPRQIVLGAPGIEAPVLRAYRRGLNGKERSDSGESEENGRTQCFLFY
jgi:hypothetical protein